MLMIKLGFTTGPYCNGVTAGYHAERLCTNFISSNIHAILSSILLMLFDCAQLWYGNQEVSYGQEYYTILQ